MKCITYCHQVANLEDLGFNSGILSGALVRMGQVNIPRNILLHSSLIAFSLLSAFLFNLS